MVCQAHGIATVMTKQSTVQAKYSIQKQADRRNHMYNNHLKMLIRPENKKQADEDHC